MSLLALVLLSLVALWFLPGKGPAGVVAFTATLGLLGLWIARSIGGQDHRRFLLWIFALAFGLRLLWGFILLNIVPDFVHNHPYLSFGYLGDDGRGYDFFAWRGAEAWSAGHNPLDSFPGGNNRGYVLVLSAVYKLLGHEPFAVRALNSFLGALIPLLVFAIAKEFLSNKYARLSAGLAAFYPGHIIYSGTHIRDISIGAAFLAALWSCFLLQRPKSRLAVVGTAALLIICVAYLASSRSYYAGVVAGALALLVAGQVFFAALGKGLTPRVGIAAVLVVGLFITIEFVLKELHYSPLWPLNQSLDQATDFYGGIVRAAPGASAGSLYTVVEPPFTIVLLPVAVLFTILNPFLLWPVVSPDPLYTILSPAILAWYALIPLVVYGAFVAAQDARGRALVLVTLAVLAILAVTGSGVQTTGRTKIPIEPLLLIFGSIGLVHFAERRETVRSAVFIYAWLLLGLIAVYLLAAERMFFKALIFAVVPLLIAVSIRQLVKSRSRLLSRVGRALPRERGPRHTSAH